MGKQKLDTAKIKHEYVCGIPGRDGYIQFLSLAELAKRHNVSESRLKQLSAAEKWQDERKLFSEETYQESTKKTLEQRVLTAVQLDELCNKIASSLLQQLSDLIEDEADKEPLVRQALRYSRNALEAQKMARIALGLPTDSTRQDGSVTLKDANTEAFDKRLASMSTDDLRDLLYGPDGLGDGDEDA